MGRAGRRAGVAPSGRSTQALGCSHPMGCAQPLGSACTGLQDEVEAWVLGKTGQQDADGLRDNLGCTGGRGVWMGQACTGSTAAAVPHTAWLTAAPAAHPATHQQAVDGDAGVLGIIRVKRQVCGNKGRRSVSEIPVPAAGS